MPHSSPSLPKKKSRNTKATDDIVVQNPTSGPTHGLEVFVVNECKPYTRFVIGVFSSNEILINWIVTNYSDEHTKQSETKITLDLNVNGRAAFSFNGNHFEVLRHIVDNDMIKKVPEIETHMQKLISND